MSAVAKAALAIALLAGGSGEPGEKKNFFLDDFKDFRKALIARGWQVEGGKPVTNAELQASAKKVLTRAKKGDRVLLVFHSHGHKQRTDWGQKSHSITSEDADASGAEPGFDLDRLQPSLLDAEKRGVNTALVDLSCYSGATLALRGPACTVTLASRKYVSLCSGRPEERLFVSHFLKLPPLPNVISIEDQFRAARLADLDSVNLPQISSRKTPAIELWDEFFEQVDPLDIYEDLKDLRTGYKPFAPSRLLDAVKTGMPARFDELLNKVLDLRKQLEAAMPALARDYDEANLAFELGDGAKLKLSPASLADLLDASEKKEDEPEDWDDVQRHRLAEIRPVRTSIAAKFRTELDAFRKRRKEFDRLTNELGDDAGGLLSGERQIYELLSTPVPGAPGYGCKNFKL